jgi:hypothetical protein
MAERWPDDSRSDGGGTWLGVLFGLGFCLAIVALVVLFRWL